MDAKADDDQDAFLAAFLQQRVADQRLGIERSLDDYCRRHPAHAAAIRAVWQDLHGAEPPPGTIPGEVMPLTMIGPYELRQRIGRGGQGDVWLGEDPRLRRRVAIKLLRGVAFADADGLERFRREAQVASRLDHPGICAVYDAGFAAGMPYLVMRYVDGEPLAAAIPRLVPRAGGDRQQQLRRVATIAERLARALHFAHEASVLHRDVKPQNVMLAANDEPVLLDFGLARSLANDVMVTRTGDQLGTPAYLPPEQLATAPPPPDPTTDVYGLGVVLYECLTGRRPFDGPTLDAIYRQITAGPTPSARQANAAVPRDLSIVAATAMQHDRSRRYHSAAAFADDLQRWLDGRPIVARPIGPLRRLWSWARRHRALAAALLALLATLSIGLVVSLTLGQRAAHLLGEWERLADRRRLDELVLEADTGLWPAVPAKVPALQAWLGRAEPLLARLPDHEQALAALQQTAASDPHDDETAWRRHQLSQLVAGLRAFADGDVHAATVASVRYRLVTAGTIATQTLEQPAEAWQQAMVRVAQAPAYGGLVLRPQLGLVPLGPDPATKLEEFADPRTGTVPTRDAGGQLQRDARTAVVFVLLPGGTFTMGAQNQDEHGSNHDPQAWAIEGPTHQVQLAAFFLAKFEMTQAQWTAAMGDHPSEAQPGTVDRERKIDERNPVTNVSWQRCATLALRLGYVLPTEAQWEYACRAGTTTPWSTGADMQDLLTSCNFADAAARGDYMPGWPNHPDTDDGHSRPAAVGSFRANALGLHDMHGNVAEWCHDAMLSYEWPVRPGTGERVPEQQPAGDAARSAATRGGSCLLTATGLRSARRTEQQVDAKSAYLGLRPARALLP